MGKIVDGIYYGSDGKPAHRGIVEVGGKIYYAGKDGVIVKDREKVIHHGMAHGLVGHGTYYFDSDGVIDLSSFVKSASHDEGGDKKKHGSSKEKHGSSEKKHSSSKSKHKHRHKRKMKKDTLILLIVTCLTLIVLIASSASSRTDKKPRNYIASEEVVDANDEPVEITEQEISTD